VAPGGTPVQFLDACGFLDAAVLAVHGVQMPRADLERLAARYLALGEERLRAGDARSALGPLRRGVALRAAARDRALAADAARMRADLRAGRDAPARRAPR